MKKATSLTVIAIGAILAFAITASPRFLNLQIVGWILMVTGAAGLALERRGRDWLRRTVIVRGSPDVSRMRRRRPPAQITAPPPAAPAQTTGEPVERETIEEYIEQ
jgi:hypothetical protein